MHQGLRDFRIENESMVLLWFTDGSRQRVASQDLSRYLTSSDLQKVQEALRLRSQFIKKILPPTVMFMLAAGVVALGNYDVHLLSVRFGGSAPSASTVAKQQPIGPAPTWAVELEPQPEPAPPVRPQAVHMTAPVSPDATQSSVAPAKTDDGSDSAQTTKGVSGVKGKVVVHSRRHHFLPSSFSHVTKQVEGAAKGTSN